MRILHLTLKKKWFDMIASGEKKEEYREIKMYWIKRLIDKELFKSEEDFLSWYNKSLTEEIPLDLVVNEFDVVEFKNGYAKDAPTIRLIWGGVKVTEGKQKWGAEKGKKYFVIKLGDLLTTPTGDNT